MLAAVVAIGEHHGVVIATFGHAGDSNMHPTIVYDAGDDEAERRAAVGDVVQSGALLARIEESGAEGAADPRPQVNGDPG